MRYNFSLEALLNEVRKTVGTISKCFIGDQQMLSIDDLNFFQCSHVFG